MHLPDLPILPQDPAQRRLSTAWMLTGVGALALSGLFSILLVLSRTPQIQDMIPFKDFFHTALVVHVDLSVLVWFLANGCLFWQLTAPRLPLVWHRTALVCFISGTLLMAASPFLGDAEPLMNNYVPVLRTWPFFIALALVTIGVCLQASSQLMLRRMWTIEKQEVLIWGSYTAALIALFSVALTLLTWWRMPDFMEGESYFEVLFWAGGHTLQFGHTQLLITCWVWLTALLGIPMALSEKWIIRILYIGILAAAAGGLPFINYALESYEFRQFFTLQMVFLGGVYVIPIGIALLFALKSGNKLSSLPTNQARPIKNGLWVSLLLFALGGIIALQIEEVDVTIPAHYHGSIVGISIAFMALHYFLLPQLGFAPVRGWLANSQPWLYGGGQALHITGLLISGGYDVARKSTESYEGVAGAQLGMGLMGLGGGLAILGGLAFVIVVLRSVLSRQPHH